MMTLEKLLFDVEMVKMEDLTGVPANSDYEYAVLGHINGEKRILNACSDRYELVDNKEIFPQIRQVLNASGLEFSETYSMTPNHARFYADYVIESEQTHIGTGSDIVKPLIRVRHSYNGMTKYAITFGYFRLICSNGLVIPVEGKESTNLNITGRHTTNIKRSFDLLIQRLDQFTTNHKIYSEVYNNLAKKEVVNVENRVLEVLNACAIPEKNSEKVIQTVKAEASNLYNGQINDWLIYNGVNQFVHKGDNKKVLEQKEVFDQKAINFLVTH
ncbi:MAG: DUF932 domain-containing protein [Bacteroidales bacterium]|nr:DUF932 domain-containing protein [Bacteroidales bacterium]